MSSSQRRGQIIEAAVRVVARDGSQGLSFAKVVQEAELSSTRLISYHFGTREALLAQSFERVLARAAEFMGPRIAEQPTMRGKIGAYIRSNLEFIATDPVYARAAVDLAGAVSSPGGGAGLALLEDGFRQGQADGELRGFDIHTAAVALRSAIDGSSWRS